MTIRADTTTSLPPRKQRTRRASRVTQGSTSSLLAQILALQSLTAKRLSHTRAVGWRSSVAKSDNTDSRWTSGLSLAHVVVLDACSPQVFLRDNATIPAALAQVSSCFSSERMTNDLQL